MTNRVILGNFQGTPRLRVSRPGFNVEDPNLTNEQLAFDSTWTNTLVIHESGNNVTLPVVRQTGIAGAGTNGILFHEYIFNEPLDYIPTAFAWLHDGNLCIPMPVYLFKDRIRIYCFNTYFQYNPITGQNISTADPSPYTFVIFANKYDSSNSISSSGYNRICLGNHPTFGSGLFISQNSKNVMTADRKDLILSSSHNCFQIEQAGSVTGLTVANGEVGANAGFMQVYNIYLSSPRTDRPPLLYHKRSYAVSGDGVQVTVSTWYQWIANDHIRVWFGDWDLQRVPTDNTLHWWLPIGDMSPHEGNSSSSTNRIWLSASSGLRVSKKNVNVLYASGSDLLFNSSYSMMNIADKTLIWPQNNDMLISNNSSGIPLVFYIGVHSIASNYQLPMATVGFIGDRYNIDYRNRSLRQIITRTAYAINKNSIRHVWSTNNFLSILYYNFMEFSNY